ncbi:hypothetical protein H3C66_03925 [Patescibacteria group bacterium]|nr:hypothetical protein [Patescibacteria group bacterium]
MSGFKSPPPGALPPGLGSPDLSDAMMDQAAAMSQQTAKTGQLPGSQAVSSLMQGHGGSAKTPRPLTGPVQEAKYVAKDVAGSFLEFLPPELQSILGGSSSDSPEEAAKKKQMLQRFNQMSAEQQQYVQKKLRSEQIEKQKKEEEEARQRQREAAQAEDVPIPQGKVTGEAAMGAGKSKKSQTISKLQNDRKKLSSSG